MRRRWLHLLQQCCQGSRCLHGSENNQSCDHIRHCTQLQPVVTRLSQVCKLAYNSGVQRAKHMCACCLANFLLHEPYQACQGPACQAWRHTCVCWRGVRSKRYRAHCPLVFGVCRRQRRPKQMNWNRGKSCSRRSRDQEMLRPRQATWNRGRSCSGRNGNSRRACGLRTGIHRVPRRRHRRAPRPSIGVRRPLMPAQCPLAWHPQPHQDQQPQHHLQQQPRQPQHRHAMKRWFCSTQLRKGSMSSMPRLTILLGKCRFSWISPVRLRVRTAALQPMQVLNRR